ncbi:hypothetical protein [Wenxinia saemankumensis]|uniref:Uncharacterized protein n=1 Tax=Wenxinia saemankumensis TaxID=1447782 RepID=A0A1M5ZZ92_9RHOB|nr:hypothetical protein [Wenxinia saemankumensis]SHI29508.1 hypothetical protein SAMN05444417_0092 [Wenxinia saemankumensis]
MRRFGDCVDPWIARQLERDGIGWGHDLDCGCLRGLSEDAPGPLARLWSALTGRAA